MKARGQSTLDQGFPGSISMNTLTPLDLNVAGGCLNGVGVSDLTFGGGELTNQYSDWLMRHADIMMT